MTSSKRRPPRSAKHLGVWTELSLAKIHGPKGKRHSQVEHMLHEEFRKALEGDVAAIRTILRMLEANRKARDEFYPEPQPPGFTRDGMPVEREGDRPRNADLALLILGICAVDKSSLDRLGEKGDPGYEARLMALAPDSIEPWVARASKSSGSSRKTSHIPEWEARKEEILSELMRVRGPGASRFRPGTSGNPRGRPRKRTTPFPYDDFFTGIVHMTVNGRKQRLTRLDALMAQVTTMAAKGNDKIRRLMLPRLMDLYEAKWDEQQERVVVPQFIRG